jgi:hypothetical protein
MSYRQDDYPEDDGETRSTKPPGGRRRRMPPDDLPPATDRPSLSRRSRAEPPPNYPPPPHVTPPVTPPPYNTYNAPDAPRAARSKRERRPAPPPSAVDKRGSGLYLPWWSLIIMLSFVGCAAIGALLIVNSIGGNTTAGGQTPVVIVITSTFTVGAPATQTSIPQRPTETQPPPLPTIAATASLPPGNFAIGETVMVVGVGPQGLNVRISPGTDPVRSAVKFRASEDERFTLKDGPQTASSEEWWFIQDPVDSNRGGWASRRFLSAIAATKTPQ